MSGAFITLAKRFACGRQRGRCQRPTDLSRNLFLLIAREGRELVVLGPDQERHCGLVDVSGRQRTTRKRDIRKSSRYTLKAIPRRRTLLNPRACRYHSLIELSVDLRERSNIKRIATASLQTSGSILTCTSVSADDEPHVEALRALGEARQGNGDCQRPSTHEFTLAAEIPDAERDLRIPYGDL